MNKNQRRIISDAYNHYLNCCSNSDIAGFTTDMRYFFIELENTDEKLKELLEEIYKNKL